MTGVVATAKVDIEAPARKVWDALTDPDQIARYMFGSRVQTDWQPGSSIVWQGEFQGRSYEDKGEIVQVDPERRLSMTHFSPLSGQPDEPANYHTVTYELTEQAGKTHVVLSQDNNASDDEAKHSAETWQSMLAGLKEVVESS